MFNFSGRRPGDLGVRDGRLKPCPGKPNCVCSQAEGGYAAIAPLTLQGDAEAAMQALAEIVAAETGATIIEQQGDYLRAEFRTALMGFVDDVEFWCDRDAGCIHLRSASRLGYSDMGVNRKRIERLRAALGSRRP